MARLFLIPLMTDDEEEQKELIFKTAELTVKLDYLDRNLLIEIVTNQILLAQAILEKNDFEHFFEVIRMADDDLLNQLLEYVVIVKEQIAWEEGIYSIVSNILANGLSYEETSKLTGLSVSEISEIVKDK